MPRLSRDQTTGTEAGVVVAAAAAAAAAVEERATLPMGAAGPAAPVRPVAEELATCPADPVDEPTADELTTALGVTVLAAGTTVNGAEEAEVAAEAEGEEDEEDEFELFDVRLSVSPLSHSTWHRLEHPSRLAVWFCAHSSKQ